MGNGKDEFLSYLDALGSYIDAGIADYLRENGLATYLEIGGLDRDLEVRKAVLTIRNFVVVDEFPWWNERAALSRHPASFSSSD